MTCIENCRCSHADPTPGAHGTAVRAGPPASAGGATDDVRSPADGARRFPLRQTRITRGSREARPRWERRSGGPRSGTAGQGTCSTPSPAIPGRPRFQWSSPLERFQWSSPLEASRRTGRPAPGRTCTHHGATPLTVPRAALHPGGPGRTGHPPRAAPNPRERYLLAVRTVLVRRENGTCSSRERYLLAVRTGLPGLAHLAGGVIGTSLAPPDALRSCPHSAAGAAQRGCSRCRPRWRHPPP